MNQMSINRRVDKQITVFSHNEILLSNKKEQITEASMDADASQNIIVGILYIRSLAQMITVCIISFIWNSRR